MMKIKSIQAREILDSKGDPTLETEIILGNGLKVKASVPSGVSVGAHEALELRDNDPKRYNGKGVLLACESVNKKISKALKGVDVTKQQEIDQKMIELDGTKNKSKLGANAILSVSLACCRAGALTSGLPLYKYIREKYQMSSVKRQMLPTPMFNIFNGGKHADTNLDFQEFMTVPIRMSHEYLRIDNEYSFGKMLEMGTEVFHSLGDVLRSHGLDTDLGNEGGYAPNILLSEEAIELILEAIKKAGYEAGKDIFLATDAGASILYNKRRKKYILKADKLTLNRDQLIDFYLNWIKRYPFISIEDPFWEEDWMGWQILNSKFQILNSKFSNYKQISLPQQDSSYIREFNNKEQDNFQFSISNLLVVGDDLFTTNIERLKKGIEMKAANAIIIKPNQIGTLTETIDCVKLAKKAQYKIICSHRSGETNDTFIADLAVAVGADFIKAGAPSRGERVAKYNRLMEIENHESIRTLKH